jgi:hypothetical protein
MKIIEGKTDRTLMEFINIKKRGNVVLSTAYNYSTEQGILYEDLLCSVEKIDDDQLEPLKQQAEMISDSEVIDIIEALIKEGTNTKMELVKATYEKANISRRHATHILEKYTETNSSDPSIFHLWEYTVGERGAKIYENLY